MRDDVSNAFATPIVMATTSGDVMSDVFSSSCDVGRNSICGVGKGLMLSLESYRMYYNKALLFKTWICAAYYTFQTGTSEFKSCILSFQINAQKFAFFLLFFGTQWMHFSDSLVQMRTSCSSLWPISIAGLGFGFLYYAGFFHWFGFGLPRSPDWNVCNRDGNLSVK